MRLQVAPGVFYEAPDDVAPEVLAELKGNREINPLLGYFPHEKQQPFHAATEVPGRAFIGGNRSGKSTAGVNDDLIQALPEKWIPEHLLPYKRWPTPFYCRIVLPGFGRPMEAVLEALRRWTPRGSLLEGGWEKGWDKQAKTVKFECGSFIEIMTYEQDEDKFGGSARHRIHWDEEVPDTDKGQTIRDECGARLVDYNGDEIFTFTPLQGLGYTFEEIWEKRGREIRSQVWLSDDLLVVQADMDDNPVLSEEGKERALAKYPDAVKSARKRGDFVHFKGLVYPEFDVDLHIVPKPEIAHVKDLDVVEGIDPGVRTTGIVFCAFDRDNSMLVFDELYLHNEDAIPENAAKHIQAKRKAWGYEPMYTVIDPSARNRNLATGINVQDAYLTAGIPTIPGQNEVEAGIFEVKRRLQAKGVDEKPQPLLLIAENCTTWAWERGRYRLDDRADGKFVVVKKHDHIMDPTRYVAMSRPIGPVASLPDQPQDTYRADHAPNAEEWFHGQDTGDPRIGSMT